MPWQFKSAIQQANTIVVTIEDTDTLDDTDEPITRSEVWTHDPKDEHLPGQKRTTDQFEAMVKFETAARLDDLNGVNAPLSVDISAKIASKK